MKGQLESYQLPKQKRQNGISLAGTLMAVSPVSTVMAPMGKAQSAAKEVLDSILDTVVRIFGKLPTCCLIPYFLVELKLELYFVSENHVVVGDLLEIKSSQQNDVNTPKSMIPDANWNHDSEGSQVTGGYSIGFSLTVLQVVFLVHYFYG